MPRPRLQLNLSILRALMNYLLMMPLLTTLTVMERLLLLKAKSKLKERRHVHLIGTRRLKRGMMKPLLFSSSFYCYLFTLCIITFFLRGENNFYSFRHPYFWVFVNNFPFTSYLLIAPCFFHLYIYTNLDILMLSSVSWDGVIRWIRPFCWLTLESFLGVPSYT